MTLKDQKSKTKFTCAADQSMQSAAFSADGSLLAAGTGGLVTLWEATTAAFIATLPPPAGCHTARFRQLNFVPGTPYLAGKHLLVDFSKVLGCASSWRGAGLEGGPCCLLCFNTPLSVFLFYKAPFKRELPSK